MPFDLHLVALGMIGWFIVFGLVQQGSDQIRAEQLALSQTRSLPTGVAKIPHLVHLVSLSAETSKAETAQFRTQLQPLQGFLSLFLGFRRANQWSPMDGSGSSREEIYHDERD